MMNAFTDTTGIYSYNLGHDYKAEVIAAGMVEDGTPIDNIVIQMLGALKRTYRKDVESIETQYSEMDYNSYTVINTPKEGIYDMLPEGLFHTVSLSHALQSQKEVAKILKRHRQEELNARNFFIPFETAINHLRIQLALYENKLDKRSHYSEFSDIFAGNWDIFKHLDNIQANLFVHMLPLMHHLRDNYPLAEMIMELILMVPVKITAKRRQPVPIENPMVSTMEDACLGVNFTTGNIMFDDGDNTLDIKLGPMQSHQLSDFTPGASQQVIFEMLCDYLLPVHLDVNTELELQAEDRVCVLADGPDGENSVMGFSTYL